MKVQVQTNYWHRIIDHYTNVLNEKFHGQLYTPTTQHFMKIVFDEAVNRAKSRETHPAWHVPLILRFEPLSHRFIIEATNPDQLELL